MSETRRLRLVANLAVTDLPLILYIVFLYYSLFKWASVFQGNSSSRSLCQESTGIFCKPIICQESIGIFCKPIINTTESDTLIRSTFLYL